MEKLNIVNRTLAEQEEVDNNPRSLWGRIDLLYRFEFTQNELQAVTNAKALLRSFSEKIAALARLKREDNIIE